MKRLILLFVLIIAFQACDKNDPTPQTSNEHVNSWILENMNYWYYWNSDIPASPDQSLAPDEFFKSLLSEHDRFSWIQDNYAELLNSLQGVNKEGGFEFALYRESNDNTNVIMQILYVKPTSPASSLGLNRGDAITKINGTQITTDNYQSLIGDMNKDYSITFKSLDFEAKTFSGEKTFNISPVEYAEDPNYLNKVFTYGDRRIGYYVYNLFSEGPVPNNKQYTTEMETVFSDFKAQGITDLVVDLRFNSGGAESAAQQLASLIAKNVTSTTVFVRHEYNDGVEADIKAEPSLGEGFLSVPFLAKSQNVGSMLTDSRVYLIVGSRTASASELIINGLKPFMDVFLVGGTTVGKNVGSISIYDANDTENKWGMQPIVVKLFNSAGQSDYENGFTPQIAEPDNSAYLYPLGDPRERLLNKTLVQITGQASISRTKETEGQGGLLFHSLDLNKRSGVTVINSPLQ